MTNELTIANQLTESYQYNPETNEARYFIDEDNLQDVTDGLYINFGPTVKIIMDTAPNKAEGMFRVGMLLIQKRRLAVCSYGDKTNFYWELAAKEGHPLAKGLLDRTLKLEVLNLFYGGVEVLIKPRKPHG
jgi:hypothetical protein